MSAFDRFYGKTADEQRSTMEIGEPVVLNPLDAERLFHPKQDTLIPEHPKITLLKQLQDSRQARDTALWDGLWNAIDPKLRKAVQETSAALAASEQALSTARGQLANLDARQPTKPADVPTWAARRGEVAGAISAYEALVIGARRSYEQAAQALLTAAHTIVAKQAKDAVAAHAAAVIEYQRRKEVARQFMNDANEDQSAVQRLFQKVTSGDLDLFR